MSARATLVVLLVAAGCGPPPRPRDDRITCGSQATCDPGRQKVCDSGFCGPALPDIGKHYESLGLRMTPSMQLAGPKALRAAVVYAATPDGKKVRCPDATLGANEVAAGTMAELAEPTKFNLTAPLLESNLHNTGGDSVVTQVSVNGAGRIVYVELYSQNITTGQPDSGGPPIGYGCVENAPFADDPAQASVNLDLTSTR